MAKIIRARAYCNNEVGYIAWDVDGPIKDSYGFQVTRIHLDDGVRHKKGERRILPAWVAFKGQSNPKWIEQDTSVWPISGPVLARPDAAPAARQPGKPRAWHERAL